MDSFPREFANTCVNVYGSALASNKDDEEEEIDITAEVRYFISLSRHMVTEFMFD